MSREEDVPPPARPAALRRIARWAGIALGGLLLLCLLAWGALHTDAGRRWVADRIEAIEFENGMKIGIGRLEGSLFGKFTIEDLTLSDPKGEFLEVPEAKLDWRPFRYLFGQIDIRSLTAASATLERVPQFRETESKGPILPDLDIDIGAFRIDRFTAEPAVAGERRILSLAGEAHVADRRALADLTLETLGEPAGDRLVASIDAVPDENRLGLKLSLHAPKDGVIAALTGLEEQMEAELQGKGDWAHWDGRLKATLGARPFADLALGARSGLFTVKGETQAAQLVEGRFAQWLRPVTRLDLAASFAGRRAQLSGSVESAALKLNGRGGVDLGQGSFEGLSLSLAMARPTELAEDLVAQGLAGDFTLNGPYKSARVDYAIRAQRVAVNGITIERLRSQGAARFSEQGFLMPLDARAARITGLDSVVGGQLADVRLGGNLAIKGPRILSDDLRLRAPRIDAKVTLVADLSKGFYAGAIDGRIADYRVASVGLFDVTSDLDLKSGARGGFTIAGKVRARSTRIENETLAGLLGGETLATGDLRYGTDGILRLDEIRVEAPLLRIEQGSGTFGPEGQLAFTFDAVTERYGPVALQLAGTISEPRATLSAERPGLGIGLAGLNAEILGQGDLYRLKATGRTDYGALTADVTLDAGDALALRINSADLGGIGFSGSLQQTPQGPFAGRLNAKGRGLGGVVQLAAKGEVQQADFNLRAKNTAIDGPAGIYVGSAIVDGRVLLYDAPEITFDAQLSDASYGALRLSAGRAKVDYRGGKGQAQFVLEGTRQFPFRLAANARLEPDLWRATMQGRIRGVTLATKEPARIVPGEGTYRLEPTDISVGKGSVRLAGDYGDGLSLKARIDTLDIDLANSFIPDFGVGGTASGSVEFAQADPAAFPQADARLSIKGFTRTTSVSVSDPVDINFVGKLLAGGGGGEASAVFRRGGGVIGRMQATLAPAPAGSGGWIDQLRRAPLSGGLRYNGPAGTLFSLAGQADQRVSGSIGLAADFSGNLTDPRLKGVIKGSGLAYENLVYGTRLSDVAVDGTFAGDRIEIASLTGKAGDGTMGAKGYVSLAAARGFPMDIAIELSGARLARGDRLSATATGSLRLTKKAGEIALLSGTIRLPETRYRLVRESVAQVPQLSGVKFKPRPGRPAITGEEPPGRRAGLFDKVRLDIAMVAPERFNVSGMGLESEWRADLTVSGTTIAPRMLGSLDIVRGTLGFAGRSFSIDEGRIRFVGGEQLDPRIELKASNAVEDITVNLDVTGRALDPQIAFSSTPALPQEEVVSRILFGRSAANLSAIQAVQLAASLNSLRGSGKGINPLDKLRSATGLDRLRLEGGDGTAGQGTSIAAGKYITDNIYVEVITDAQGFTATQLEISLTRALSILSQTGGSGTSDFSIQYEKNY